MVGVDTKQTNKQTNNQPTKQTNKQTNNINMHIYRDTKTVGVAWSCTYPALGLGLEFWSNMQITRLFYNLLSHFVAG